MKKIYSGTDMKKVDDYSINLLGIPSLVLMERAALCVANTVKSIYEKEKDNSIDMINADEKHIVALCGVGNNGADGICAIRILKSFGYNNLSIVTIGDETKATEEYNKQIEIVNNLNVKNTNIKSSEDIEECLRCVDENSIIIDAVFGIGLKREVTGIFSEIFSKVNSIGCKKIAVDIASGIDSNTGKMLGNAIKCDKTVTFGSYKIGHFIGEGALYAGEVEACDIGFPVEAYKASKPVYSLEQNDLVEMFPKRSQNSNKGTYGKLTIIAGNEEMCGAACMCAKAAFYLGVGLIRVVTTHNNKNVLNTVLPEAIVDSYEDIDKAIDWCDVLVAGPGMGVSERSYNILKKTLDCGKPLVIDADGINTFVEYKDLYSCLHKYVIFTPHLAEMSRLSDEKISIIKEDMIMTATRFVEKYNVNLVMKDYRTVITDYEGNVYINMTGNSGMSKAGSGDVLAGIIGALLATTKDVKKSSYLGPYIHGIAGNIAKDEYGEYAMMPTDIIKALKRIEDIK